MSILKKDKPQELLKYLTRIRKNVPKQYNNFKLLDNLANDKVDLLFSITTRGDGKTFNYLYALAKLSEKFQFCTIVIVRHMEVRAAMIQQIRDVYDTMDDLFLRDFTYKLSPDYVLVQYKGITSFIVCDLNNANDLKNYSAVLRHANLILYDEFLAVGGEYTPHEFIKFKTIFETMDRALIDSMKYTNNRRKAIFLANPVDFSSEFLAQWHMYHYLEAQEMNTIKVFKNIAIERRKNIAPQANKNNRIFNDDANESILGTFHVNNWSIEEPKVNMKKVTVKLAENYLNIFLSKGNKPILDVSPYEKNYFYNTELVDNADQSKYLKPSYYRDTFYKKYTQDRYKFSNQYSKSFILENYSTLNVNRIIRENINVQPSFKQQDEQRKKIDLELLKQRLLMQYL